MGEGRDQLSGKLKVNHMVLYPKTSLSGLVPETLMSLSTWDWWSGLQGLVLGTEQFLLKSGS